MDLKLGSVILINNDCTLEQSTGLEPKCEFLGYIFVKEGELYAKHPDPDCDGVKEYLDHDKLRCNRSWGMKIIQTNCPGEPKHATCLSERFFDNDEIETIWM
jgi:hypothetical protein